MDNFSWKKVISLSGAKWSMLIVIVLLILIQALLSPLAPMILAEIIDKGFLGNSRVSYSLLLLSLFTVSYLSISLSTIQRYVTTLFSSQITLNIRKKLFSILQRQPISFFTETKIGEIQSRLTMEVEAIGGQVFAPIFDSIKSLLSIFTTLTVMFYINYKLTLVILLVIPLLFLPLPLFNIFAYRISKGLVERNVQFTSFVTENLTISGMMLIKVFGGQTIANVRFEELSNQMRQVTLKQSILNSTYHLFFSIGIVASPILVYWFGRPQGLDVTPGVALAFATYIAALFQPLQSVGQISMDLQTAKVVFGRIFKYLDDEPILEKPYVRPQKVKGAVRFKNVIFEYEPGKKVLNNINLDIKAKEKIALVGYSGSGKTTIAYLLTKLYEPSQGSIKIDGIDINDFSSEEMSNYVTLISQEVYLLHSTIKDNIMVANPNATIDQIIQAAKNANIHEKIISLPQGYETIVGERGYKLSGGEKQRIAIARGFLKDAPILILDEATSALDTFSESIVQQALNELMQNRTVFIISHRLKGIMNCDRVLVIDNGIIVEDGSHQELLMENGLYVRLFSNHAVNQ